MDSTYTPEMVWDSATDNEMTSAYEEKRKISDSRFYAARKIEFYAEMFGADVKACIAYGRANYRGFDWARNHEDEFAG